METTIRTTGNGTADIIRDGEVIGTAERYQHFTGREDANGIPITRLAWMAYTGRNAAGSYGVQSDRLERAEVRNKPTRAKAVEALMEIVK